MYVYIITNKPRGTLYTGVTNDITRRIYGHETKIVKGFTEKYRLDMLVYVEQHEYPRYAITREKQLKNWHRDWKINMIESMNPSWQDLYSMM